MFISIQAELYNRLYYIYKYCKKYTIIKKFLLWLIIKFSLLKLKSYMRSQNFIDILWEFVVYLNFIYKLSLERPNKKLREYRILNSIVISMEMKHEYDTNSMEFVSYSYTDPNNGTSVTFFRKKDSKMLNVDIITKAGNISSSYDPMYIPLEYLAPIETAENIVKSQMYMFIEYIYKTVLPCIFEGVIIDGREYKLEL